MASATPLSPTFLICTICTETYRDPCTLSCHHTFCRKCILKYLQTCSRPNSIQCPSCRHSTKVQDSTQPLTQWVDQLTPNPIVLKLATSENHDSEDLKKCFLCYAKGTSVVGKFWCHICDIAMCDTCHQTHCLIPITRDHDVSEFSQYFKITRKRKVNCQDHPKNEIEFCCKTCDKPICQVCCILYHRKCDEVVTMESLKPEMQTKLNQLVEEISKTIEEMSINVNLKRLMVTEVEGEATLLQTEVSEICQQAHDLVAKKEAKMKQLIQENTKEKIKLLQTQLATESMNLQSNHQRKAYLDQLQQEQSTMDIFNMLRTQQEHITPLVNSASDVLRNFTLTSDMEAFKSDVDNMLRLEVEPFSDPNSTPVLHSTIDSNPATNLVVLEINGTDVCVVTYFGVNHIKAFWMEETRRESTLNLDNYAWGITHLKENQVAVTIPAGKSISLLNIGANISTIKSIPTERCYFGFASVDENTFAAGSSDDKCIDLINLRGTILTTVSDKYILSPYFIVLTGDSSLLVSDRGSKSVYNMTTDGILKFRYSPKEGERQLQENRGIAITKAKHVLVTDKKANKIILLSKYGQFVRDVLTAADGLDQPYGLCVHGNKLYITQRAGPVMIYEAQYDVQDLATTKL